MGVSSRYCIYWEDRVSESCAAGHQEPQEGDRATGDLRGGGWGTIRIAGTPCGC